ncbi:MAG TPA: flagellar hook-basal body complex protein [Desulfovibrio sp.]|uniref:flagellar hook protein FlgE n=1 Tax=Desulfovibrio sp. TaxID=885 RepID=UPI002D4B7314|nr:flagellar hook-basal body complex protein [Desulfovibrio sp.]HZF62815.1 flagellar hook-basal body complex protein [Desulfovibrio sp.]
MNSSLFIGATGMKTLSSGMNVISNNIANVSTIGYKQQTALFSDVFYAQQGNIGESWDSQTNSKVALGQVGQGVQMDAVLTRYKQGGLESTNTVTDMAISGKGFFQVTDKTGEQYYTRAGDLRPDNQGVWRTPAGMALMGYKYAEDGTKGALAQVTVDRFAKMPAKATTAVDMRFNVGQSKDTAIDPANPYFSLIGQYNAANVPPMNSSSYGYGQSITLYGADGTGHSATIYFDGAPSTTPGTTVEYLIASDADAKGGKAQPLMAGTLSFNANGELSGMSAYTPSTAGSTNLADWNAATLSKDGIPQMTVNGAPVTVNLGITAKSGWQNSPGNAASVGTDPTALASMGNAYTRAADATTNYTSSSPVTRTRTQDGYAEGTLNNISISADGTVVGKFSNNKSMDLWQIPVCRFTSEDGLRREGNNLFAATKDSGNMEMGVAGTENYGKINAYNIENSNVDMSQEMVNMIVNQRGFQSNSKVVTTADQMLQKAMELKR